MRFLVVLFVVCLTVDSKAQNLVPNPSFEEALQCPWSLGVFEVCVKDWYNPTLAFPDYYNACDHTGFGVPHNDVGYQQARTGHAYGGLVVFTDPNVPGPPDYREYIASQLTEPLEQDTPYCVTLYTCMAGGLSQNQCAVSNIGLYLGVDSVYDNQKDTLSYTPQIQNDPLLLLQDTLNWMKISGTFVAQGGEQYIVIGNFSPNDQTNAVNISNNEAYYYIDDVSVERFSQVGLSANALVDASAGLQLFPNPTIDFLRYQSSEPAVRVSVYDATGREISRPVVNPIDVSRLCSGAYVLELTTARHRYHQRFVKQ